VVAEREGGLGLTSYEIDVLLGLARGWSNDQIARRQYMSRSTVKRLLGCLAARFGTSSRAGLVGAAYHTGLLADVAPEARQVQPLSQRQLQVLQAMADGLGRAEIAGRLGISVHSVHTHVRLLFRQLDAHSRSQAVALGYRYGYLIPGGGGLEPERQVRADDEPAATLPPRQLAVIMGLARGLSDAEIAQRIGVRPEAVPAILKQIRAGLGRYNRAGLVGLAYRLGILADLRPEPRSQIVLVGHRWRVLQGLADGLEPGDIAVRLRLAEPAVQAYVSHVVRLLEARYEAHAVALGYQHGYLSVSDFG
jgi:DNA-binding NarL/FixJ family response regulator